jgi:hypothetical protein
MCYRHPIPVEFDRYLYEAVVRTDLGQNIDQVFAIIKHESPRIENSPSVPSAEHLGLVEPMFAVKPLYIRLLVFMARLGLPIQKSISLVSAGSYFILAMIVGLWTRRPIPAALLVSAPQFLELGRTGTPDALAAVFVLLGIWGVERGRLTPGISFLMISIWARTDNLLIVVTVLAWLFLTKRLPFYAAGALALTAFASVQVINHFTGNHGWRVLFRCSFLACAPLLTACPPLRFANTWAYSLLSCPSWSPI